MDDDANVTTRPKDQDTPRSTQPAWKTWAAVGATAAVVGGAAVFAIGATDSSTPDTSIVAASRPADGTGATQAPSGAGDGSARPGSADAPNGAAGRPSGFGTIASIDGSTLTLEDQSGTTTKVLTSTSTVVTTSSTGSVSEVKVGDTVMVIGTGSGSQIAATRVVDAGVVSADRADAARRDGMGGPPGGGPGGAGGPGGMAGTRGVVQSVGDGTLTITSREGSTVTVTTSSSTEITIAETGTVADLQVGDQIMVMGTESDGTITATKIREGGRPGGPPPGSSSGSRPPSMNLTTQ